MCHLASSLRRSLWSLMWNSVLWEPFVVRRAQSTGPDPASPPRAAPELSAGLRTEGEQSFSRPHIAVWSTKLHVFKHVHETAEKFAFVCFAWFVCFRIKMELSQHITPATGQIIQQKLSPSHSQSNGPYSIQWDLRKPEGTQAGLLVEGCERGTPVARVCSSVQCLSLRSSVQCLHFSAWGFLRSRSWKIKDKPIKCVLQQWAHSVGRSVLWVLIVSEALTTDQYLFKASFATQEVMQFMNLRVSTGTWWEW